MSKFKNNISVVIPTRNRPDYLKNALQSVFLQNLNDIEVVVIDDCSNYDVRDVLKSFAQFKPILIKNNMNRGQGFSRNRGIEACSGDVICFLDDDDEFKKGYIENIIDLYRQSIDFTWSSVEYFFKDQKGNQLKELIFDKPSNSDSDALNLIKIGVGHGFTCKKDVLRSIRYFDESLELVEDTDVFLKLLNASCKYDINRPIGIRVNQHIGPRLTDKKYNLIRAKETLYLLKTYSEYLEKNIIAREHLIDHYKNLIKDN